MLTEQERKLAELVVELQILNQPTMQKVVAFLDSQQQGPRLVEYLEERVGVHPSRINLLRYEWELRNNSSASALANGNGHDTHDPETAKRVATLNKERETSRYGRPLKPTKRPSPPRPPTRTDQKPLPARSSARSAPARPPAPKTPPKPTPTKPKTSAPAPSGLSPSILKADELLMQLLRSWKLVPDDRLQECRSLQFQHSKRLGALLLDRNYVDDDALSQAHKTLYDTFKVCSSCAHYHDLRKGPPNPNCPSCAQPWLEDPLSQVVPSAKGDEPEPPVEAPVTLARPAGIGEDLTRSSRDVQRLKRQPSTAASAKPLSNDPLAQPPGYSQRSMTAAVSGLIPTSSVRANLSENVRAKLQKAKNPPPKIDAPTKSNLVGLGLSTDELSIFGSNSADDLESIKAKTVTPPVTPADAAEAYSPQPASAPALEPEDSPAPAPAKNPTGKTKRPPRSEGDKPPVNVDHSGETDELLRLHESAETWSEDYKRLLRITGRMPKPTLDGAEIKTQPGKKSKRSKALPAPTPPSSGGGGGTKKRGWARILIALGALVLVLAPAPFIYLKYLDPDRFNGDISRAASLQSEKKWAEAREIYDRILSSDADNEAAKAGKATCDTQLAMIEKRGILEDRLAKVAASMNDIPAAMKLVKEALDAVPGDPRALLYRARLHRQQGRMENLALKSDEAKSLYKMALDDIMAAMSGKPALEGKDLSQARFIELRLFEADLPEASKADGLRRKFAGMEGRGLAETYARGRLAQMEKNWDKAEEQLMAALTEAPDQPELLAYLARVRLEAGRNAKARESVNRAMKLQGSTVAYGVAARLDIIGRDWKMAKIHIKKALELNPANALALACQGLDLENDEQKKPEAERRYNPALAAYNKALELNEDLEFARVRRFELAYQRRDYRAALGDLRKLKAGPNAAQYNNMDVLRKQAECQRGLKIFDAAAQTYAGLVTMIDNSSVSEPEKTKQGIAIRRDRYGVLLNQKDLKTALEDVEWILNKMPEDSMAWFQKGYVLAKMRKREEASKVWRAFIAKFPNDPKVSAIERDLERMELGLDILDEYDDAMNPGLKRSQQRQIRRERKDKYAREFGGSR